MKLRAQQNQWNHLAREDPFWAILSDPGKRGGLWDPEQFFATGPVEIDAALHYAQGLGLPATRRRALDFGCGAGRLSQALAQRFEHVTGVDISPKMIELAQRYNRAGERCNYVVNTQNHLRQFAGDTFDLVYSWIVLQHMSPRHARSYVREFVRVLRPGGLALFQLPSRLASRSAWSRLGYHVHLFTRRRILRDANLLEMHGVPREVVQDDLQRCGGRLVDVQPDTSAAPEWQGWRYAVTKG